MKTDIVVRSLSRNGSANDIGSFNYVPKINKTDSGSGASYV